MSIKMKLYSFIEGYVACLKGRAITERIYMYVQMCKIAYKHGIEKYSNVHSYDLQSHLTAAIKQRYMDTTLSNTTYLQHAA